MVSLRSALALAASISLTAAHTVITYPGWRGNNLHQNGTVGVDDYQPDVFPYGMQWMFPCGGLKNPGDTNRTWWPLNGGALGFQPGWFQGHLTALIYVNFGLPPVFNQSMDQNVPINYTTNVVKPFQITGPTNEQYAGPGVCIQHIPMPQIPGFKFEEGMPMTIQLVEAAQHGAALFSCVDVWLTSNMSKVNTVTSDNCFNSPQISQQYQVFTTSTTGSASRKGVAGALGVLTLGAAVWSLL